MFVKQLLATLRRYTHSRFRKNLFDRKLDKNRSIADVLIDSLNGVSPVICDVGARNGMMMLPKSYAERATLLGFEPNKDEHLKLTSHLTDAHRAGAPIPRFLREIYTHAAAWDQMGSASFDVTIGPGACTMMGHTLQNTTRNMIMDLGDRSAGNFEDLHAEVTRSYEVPCTTIDITCQQQDIDTIDMLKLDCEGAELKCMIGTQALISKAKVLLVYSEFVMFPYYNDSHPTLSEQLEFLQSNKYRIIGLDLGHEGYQWKSNKLPSALDRRLVHAGDLWACPDPDLIDLSSPDKHRLGILLLIFGYHSLALQFIEDAGLTDKTDLRNIQSAVAQHWNFKRLKKWWQAIPDRAAKVA